MLNLEELVFKVNTTELKTAVTAVDNLGKAVTRLNKPVQENEMANAKLAKAQAQANEAAAKAEIAQTKLGKAQTDVAKSTKESVSVLQRQQDILGFMADGFSKGQASTLAYAKATGAVASEMKELGNILDRIRVLQGAEPFDKSMGAMKALENEFRMLTEVNSLYSKQLGLTSRQMTELAREKIRLTEKFKIEGKSVKETEVGLKELEAAYVRNATAENSLSSSMKSRQKTINDAASANDYLAKEMDRVNRMLTAGSDITSTTNNRLIRFEEALKKSGKTAEQQAVALAKYKQQLLDIQKAGGNRQVDYLSRALGPQITDIFVGLSTGQAPLTVLMQQGGQLRDQFALAGVAGKDMAEMMKTAAKTMVTSIKDVALAVGSLVTGAFVDLGKAIVDIPLTILKESFNSIKAGTAWIKSGFKDVTQLVASFESFAIATSRVLPYIGLISSVLAVAYAQVIKEQSALSKALTLTGAGLGLNYEEALKFASGMESAGISTSKSMAILTEFAKEGVSATTTGLTEMIKVAKDLETFGGKAVKETAKDFVELSKNPTESLIKFATETGRVELAVLKQVQALEKQGKFIEAITLAQDAYTKASKEMANELESNLSPIEKLWIDIKKGIGSVWEEIKNLVRAGPIVDAFRLAWQTVAVIVSETWFVIKAVATEVGGIAAQLAALLTGNWSRVGAIREEMIADAKVARAEQDKLVASILNMGKASEDSGKKTGAQLKANSDAARLYGEQLKKNKDHESGVSSLGLNSDNTISNLEKQFNNQLKLAKDYAKNDLAIQKARMDAGLISEEEYYSNTIGLIKQGETEQLYVINSFDKQYEAALQKRIQDATTALQAGYTANKGVKDEVAKNKKITDDYLSVVNNLINGYETWTDKVSGLKEALADLGISRTIIDAIKAEKAIQDVVKAANEYGTESNKTIRSTVEQNSALDTRVLILGKTAEEQKLISREADRQLKIAKVIADTEEKILKIKTDPRLRGDVFEQQAQIAKAYEAQAEQIKVINKEVAVQAKEDFQAEFNKIRDGISDAIVTALFEGGQAGKKKLRDLLVAELKKPITLYVNAVVDTFMKDVLGISSQGSSGGGSGGSGGSILNGAGSLLSTSGIGSAISSVGSSMGWTAMADFGMGMNIGGVALGQMGGVSAAASLGGAVAQAIPYIGWALAIANLISGMDDSGTLHTGGVGSFSKAGGSQFGQSTSDLLGYTGTAFNLDAYSQDTGKTSAKIAESIVGILDSTAKTFGKEAGYYAATGFADDTSDSGAWGQLMIKLGDKVLTDWGVGNDKWPGRTFSDGEAGQKDYANAIAKDVRDVLIEQTPDWADAMLNALGDAPTIEELASVIDKINAIASAFVNMGKVLPQLAGLSDEATTHLMNLFGSIENLSTAASTYYQNFYSDAEKFTTSQRMLKDSFTSLNIAMPSSIANFRQLVESQDLTTEAGRKMYASLLNIAPAFYEVANAIESAFAQISQSTADSIREIEMSIMTDAQKYDYLDAEIEGLLTKLSKAVDPTEIVGLYNKINSNIMEAYNLLPDTEKTRLNSQYVDRLGTAEAAAQSRLKLAGGTTLEEEQAKAAKEQKETNEIIKQTAKDNLEAATIIRKAAEDMVEAANTAQTINIKLNDKASSQITF